MSYIPLDKYITKDDLEKRDTTFIDEYNNTSATGVPKYYSNLDILYSLILDNASFCNDFKSIPFSSTTIVSK